MQHANKIISTLTIKTKNSKVKKNILFERALLKTVTNLDAVYYNFENIITR